MRFQRKRKKNEIYAFMISLNIIMGVIMLSIGGYIYSFYYKNLLNEFISSNEQFQESIVLRHENDIQIMNDIMSQLSFSEGITLFKLDEQAVKSRYLIEKLYAYTNVSQSFGQMIFCYHDDHYVYNSLSSFEIDMVLEKGMILEKTSQNDFRNYLYNSQNVVILPEQQASGYMTYRYKEISDEVTLFFLPVLPKKVATILFVVDEDYYDRILECKEEDERETFLYYDGQLIVRRGNIEIEDIEEVGRIAAELTNGICKIDGTSYLVTTSVGKSGITYVTMQPKAIFLSSFLTGQWGIFLLVIISYVITSIILFVYRNSFDKKVKSITSLLNEEDESFSNIEKGIRQLDENKKASEKAKFINNFICNEYPTNAAMLSAAKQLKIAADKSYYIVVLLGRRGNSNGRKLDDIVLDMLEKEIYIDGYGVGVISKNQSLFVLFGNSKADILDFLDTTFAIGKKICEELVMSASAFHKDYESASSAYFEADAAYDNRLLTDNNKIIFYENVITTEYMKVISDSFLQRLKNAIRSGQIEVVETVIDEICEKMQKDNHSLLSFRLICNDILHVILEESKGSSGNSIYSVYTLSQCMTIKDFKGVLMDVCKSIIDSGDGAMHVLNDDSIVPEAIKLMQSEYADTDFNMSYLAEKLGISAVTLSVNFKNEMDISPSDYLATVRMEKAKELLRHTNKKIKEIGFEVGYEDDHVFTRRFKKYTGKTPGQYRADYLK